MLGCSRSAAIVAALVPLVPALQTVRPRTTRMGVDSAPDRAARIALFEEGGRVGRFVPLDDHAPVFGPGGLLALVHPRSRDGARRVRLLDGRGFERAALEVPASREVRPGRGTLALPLASEHEVGHAYDLLIVDFRGERLGGRVRDDRRLLALEPLDDGGWLAWSRDDAGGHHVDRFEPSGLVRWSFEDAQATQPIAASTRGGRRTLVVTRGSSPNRSRVRTFDADGAVVADRETRRVHHVAFEGSGERCVLAGLDSIAVVESERGDVAWSPDRTPAVARGRCAAFGPGGTLHVVLRAGGDARGLRLLSVDPDRPGSSARERTVGAPPGTRPFVIDIEVTPDGAVRIATDAGVHVVR